jgi:hypothetical protein
MSFIIHYGQGQGQGQGQGVESGTAVIDVSQRMGLLRNSIRQLPSSSQRTSGVFLSIFVPPVLALALAWHGMFSPPLPLPSRLIPLLLLVDYYFARWYK